MSLNKLRAYWKNYGKLTEIILVPLLCSPIPIAIPSKPAYAGFIILVLSLYWILECVPLPITSVLPVFLFPVFGIIKGKEISPNYFQDSVMFIFASLIIGIGIETSGLHRKIALKVCMIVGSKPKWLLLGIMSVTGFLSIWISNTATTSMILPIVISIVKQIVRIDPRFKKDPKKIEVYELETVMHESISGTKLKNTETESENEPEVATDAHHSEELTDEILFESKEAKKMLKGFCLSITYAATIGGTASLIGTSSNVVFKNHFDKFHPNDSMNFLTFMLYSFPISLVLTLLCWVILCFVWLPKDSFIDIKSLFRKKSKVSDVEANVSKSKEPNYVENMIRTEYYKLGPLTWEQISIGFWFVLVVLLWITRDLYFVPGWSIAFETGFMTDTSSAIFVLFCASSWPKENIFKGKKYEPLMSWPYIQKQFPWGVILLVGGSLALAEGSEKSGLSNSISDLLEKIIPKNDFLALLIISLFSAIGTEFISNLSMASILLPILENLAKSNNIEYHFLLLPQAIAVNFSFMFPAASPSNAIVYSYGYLKLSEMVVSGIVVKIFALLVLFLSTTWLNAVFVSNPVNSTTTAFEMFTTVGADPVQLF